MYSSSKSNNDRNNKNDEEKVTNTNIIDNNERGEEDEILKHYRSVPDGDDDDDNNCNNCNNYNNYNSHDDDRCRSSSNSSSNHRRTTSSSSSVPYKAKFLDLMQISQYNVWKTHKIFPFGLLFHLLLLIFTSYDIAYQHSIWGPYRVSNQDNFCFFLFPEKCVESECGEADDYGLDNLSNCFLYSMTETFDSVQYLMDEYSNIKDKSLAGYSYLKINGTDDEPIADLHIMYDDGSEFFYDITKSNLGPFHPNQRVNVLNDFFHNLKWFSISFVLEDTFQNDPLGLCYEWNVKLTYSLKSEIEIALNIDSEINSLCNSITNQHKYFGTYIYDNGKFVLGIINLFAALALFCTCMKEIIDSYRLLKYTEKLFINQMRDNGDKFREIFPWVKPNWVDISWQTKIRFFDNWAPLQMIVSGLSVYFSVTDLLFFNGAMFNIYSGITQGITCFLLWVSAMRYVKIHKKLYLIISLIKCSIFALSRIFITVLPGAIGYAILGLIIFGDAVPRFGSLGKTIMTLFCTWKSDELLATINVLRTYNDSVAIMYIAVFCFFFIYVLLNICLAILEQSLFCLQQIKDKLAYERVETMSKATHPIHKNNMSSFNLEKILKNEDDIFSDLLHFVDELDGKFAEDYQIDCLNDSDLSDNLNIASVRSHSRRSSTSSIESLNKLSRQSSTRSRESTKSDLTEGDR